MAQHNRKAGEALGKFVRAQAIIFVNGDMLMVPELIEATKWALRQKTEPHMFLVGRKFSTDRFQNRRIDFSDDSWVLEVRRTAIANSYPHRPLWLDLYAQDYFVWTADGGIGDVHAMPEFYLGVAGYDNWLVARAIANARNTFNADLSRVVPALHQSHPATAHRFEYNKNQHNLMRAGDWRVGATTNTTYFLRFCHETKYVTGVFVADRLNVFLQACV
jgi:hypothetical protein